MKKICLILILLAGRVLAQGSHNDSKWFNHFVRESTNNRTTVMGDTVKVGFPATSDTTISIRSTNSDCTRVYSTSPYMWGWTKWTESVGDSVNLKIVWFMAPATQYAPGKIPAYSRFVRVDSVTIARDNTQEEAKKFNIAASAIPNYPWIFFQVTGLAAQDKSVGATGLFILSHWSELPRP
jgi:hypothetical protein